nr:GNAT family N-acetyltransferase [Agromyces seonyuensis]
MQPCPRRRVDRGGTVTEDRIVVRRNAEEHRFEIREGGELAGYAVYREEEGRTVFTHTIVLPAFGGRGLGTRLAKAALDAVVEDGGPIVPRCPFIASYLVEHPEYAAHVEQPGATAS